MKRLADFISPWALAAIALWVVIVAVYASVAKYSFVTIGDGPCSDPCRPVPLRVDWFPVLGTAVIVASIIVAVLGGFVLLARRRVSSPWLLAGIVVWLVVLFFAYPWVIGLELFKTLYPPVNGGVWSYSVQNQPILSMIVAIFAASTLTGLLAGIGILGRRIGRRLAAGVHVSAASGSDR